MERKEITAYLIDCKPGEFMGYADQKEKGTVVVGPDGKKYRFSNNQLDQAAAEIKRKHVQEATSGAAADKPKPAQKKRAPAPAKSGTASAGAESKPRKRAASTTSKKREKPRSVPSRDRKSGTAPKPVHGRTDRGTA